MESESHPSAPRQASSEDLGLNFTEEAKMMSFHLCDSGLEGKSTTFTCQVPGQEEFEHLQKNDIFSSALDASSVHL